MLLASWKFTSVMLNARKGKYNYVIQRSKILSKNPYYKWQHYINKLLLTFLHVSTKIVLR